MGGEQRRYGALLVLVIVAALAMALTSSTAAAPRPVVPRVAACGALPPPEPTERSVSRQVPEDSAPTISERARSVVDLPGILQDLRSVVRGYTLRDEVLVGASGMRVELYSDGPVRVDAAALAELMRLPLDEHRRLGDRRMRALAGCYRDRVLAARELAGTVLRLYVPADPRTCVVAGRLVRRDTHCDAGGLTVPAVDVSVPGIRLSAPASILVAPGVSTAEGDPTWAAAWLLLHELVHHYDNHLGLPPWRSSLKAYEQRAYYVERQLREQVIGGRMDIPRPLRWPDPEA